MRLHDYDEDRSGSARRRGGGTARRFDDDEPGFLKRARPATMAAVDTNADTDRPDSGDRWSSWDQAVHGPEPHPAWLVTALAATDIELGVLKTG